MQVMMEQIYPDEDGTPEEGHFFDSSTKMLEHVKMLAEEAQQIICTIALLQVHASSVNCGLQDIVRMMSTAQFRNLPTYELNEKPFESLAFPVMNADQPESMSCPRDDHYWDFFDSPEPQNQHDSVSLDTALGDWSPRILMSKSSAFENVCNRLNQLDSPFFGDNNGMFVEPMAEFESSLRCVASPLTLPGTAFITDSHKSMGCEVFNLSSTLPDPEGVDDIFAGPLAKLEAASNFIHESLRPTPLNQLTPRVDR